MTNKEAFNALEAITNALNLIDVSPKAHEGACGPEAGCDASCINHARASETIRKAYRAMVSLLAHFMEGRSALDNSGPKGVQ